MRTSVLAILSGEDADKLMELSTAVSAIPYDYSGNVEFYNIAKRAHYNLTAFKARMLDKYLAPERTRAEIEDIYGDYGYDFDPVAGTITKDES
jgi:hypothetical protein